MKNTLEGINSILGDREEHINNLKDQIMEIIQSQQQKEKHILKNENSLRDLWESIKHTNICIIGGPEEEEREKGKKVFDEIMAENFPNLKKETDIQVHEA